ncbi:hypothetical protein ACLK2A_14800 [Escherichia coli]
MAPGVTGKLVEFFSRYARTCFEAFDRIVNPDSCSMKSTLCWSPILRRVLVFEEGENQDQVKYQAARIATQRVAVR